MLEIYQDEQKKMIFFSYLAVREQFDFCLAYQFEIIQSVSESGR